MPVKTIELVVTIKVPDTTAITALQALQRMGFGKIKEVKRHFYYRFSVEGNEEDFRNSISKADILVNTNKHSFEFGISRDDRVKVMVTNTDDGGSSLLPTLKNRLGFSNIRNMESGVIYSLKIDSDAKESKKIAENAAKDLLVNGNYQEFRILQ